MTEQPILKIENIEFAIAGHTILKDISCCFATGGIHGLIGPNGSGKSTLLRNICRIWKPQSGRILIDGQDYHRFSRQILSRTVTLVQQDTHLDFSITVFDFVAMGRHPHLKRLQWLRQHDLDVIEEALLVTGTEIFRNRLINELSGGEVQLVNLARALATEASIILLDEPTSALDILHKLEIMELLTRLRNAGKTILISIHDLDLARRYCDTVTLLQQGYIYYHGMAEKGFAEQSIKEVFRVGVEEITTEHGVSLFFYR